jgi:MbtH protein
MSSAPWPETPRVPSPFEDEAGRFHVLVNVEAQYSLWPAWAAVPSGWTIALDAASRRAAMVFIEEHWRDMRPASLVRFMTPPEVPATATAISKDVGGANG